MTKKIKAVFIAGPTASGKSDLAVWLAKKINGEIINADSRQVYQFLDIGSGKIVKKEMQGIKHYLLSVASPKRNYSLARWLKDVDQVTKKILARKKKIIFCGGTILYLRALKEGWILPQVKPNYNLRKKLEKLPSEALWQRLKKLDPERASEIDPHNKKRIIRALEIISVLQKVPKLQKNPKYKLLILATNPEISVLEKKIKKRLEKRIIGIIREIKKLRKKGLSWQRIISFGLEYRWFGLYCFGKIDLSVAKEKCYRDIIRFAKRQIRELKKIDGVCFVKSKRDLYLYTKKFFKEE